MGCGLSGWRENTPFDVDGRTCAAIIFAREGETLFDRAWIDGNRLRFSAFPVKWSNRSPNDRPQSPLETVYYRTSYQTYNGGNADFAATAQQPHQSFMQPYRLLTFCGAFSTLMSHMT